MGVRKTPVQRQLTIWGVIDFELEMRGVVTQIPLTKVLNKLYFAPPLFFYCGNIHITKFAILTISQVSIRGYTLLCFFLALIIGA